MESLKRTLVMCLIVAVVSGTPVEDDKRSRNSTRIVGGQKAGDGAVPYQVSMRSSSNRHFCGGSIIGKKTILTAAHCVVGTNPSNIIIVVGTNKLTKGGTTYQAKKIVIHPSYDDKVIVHDIALVFVDREIEFNDLVQKISLALDDVVKGDLLLLTGWGSLYYMGAPPNDLQTINLKTIDTELCKTALKKVNAVFDTQICTLNRFGQGACNGDSGGPLVFNGQQVGVVSWGYPCAVGLPDVFTKVTAYWSWLLEHACEDLSADPAACLTNA